MALFIVQDLLKLAWVAEKSIRAASCRVGFDQSASNRDDAAKNATVHRLPEHNTSELVYTGDLRTFSRGCAAQLLGEAG
jgi:hypothetical protein